jgi:hypothetical protein
MASEAQKTAQESLTILEQRFASFSREEYEEIETLRYAMRNMIERYGASAELAIICVSFEIAIKEKQ